MQSYLKNLSSMLILCTVCVVNVFAASENNLSEVIEQLKDPNPEVRLRAVLSIGNIRENKANVVPYLVKALGDEYEQIGEQAAKSLGEIGPLAKSAVPDMIYKSKIVGWSVKSEIIIALTKISPDSENVIEEIIKHLNVLNPTCLQAIKSLGVIGKPAKKAIPILLQLAANIDNNIDIRSEAISSLGKMGKDSVPGLVELLNSELPDVRQEAIKALSVTLPELDKASVSQYVPNIKQVLKDNDPWVRVYAVHALGKIKGNRQEYIPVLVESLKDWYLHVRVAALESLGNVGILAKDVVPAIADTLKDEESKVRIAAIKTLEKIGTPEAKEIISKYKQNNK